MQLFLKQKEKKRNFSQNSRKLVNAFNTSTFSLRTGICPKVHATNFCNEIPIKYLRKTFLPRKD